jgi:type I restriction enzyme S subunit
LLAFDALYLFHFLRSRRHELGLLGTGVTQKNIYLGDIKTFEIPVAPRAEQTRIVAKLEELLSDLDAGVAELKAAREKLAQYRQSLLKAAVEGALTAGWRTKHKPTETGAQLLQRILTERRARWEAKQLARFAEQCKAPPKDWQKKYPEPVQPNTTDLPELAEGWVWASVEQLAELVSGHTPKDAATVSTQDGVVPWFKVGDMNRPSNEEWMSSATVRFSREVAESLGMKIMPAGTIIFPKRGGAIATNKKRKLGVDACYDLNTMGLVPVITISDWLWTWLMGVDLGRLVDGAIIPQINNPDIAPLCVPIPPSSEQREIILVVNQQIEAVGNQANAIDLSLKQSTAQRQNILRSAFAGELVAQDPNDEPASVLLERIRAERAARDAVKKPRARKAKGVA